MKIGAMIVPKTIPNGEIKPFRATITGKVDKYTKPIKAVYFLSFVFHFTSSTKVIANVARKVKMNE